MNVADQLIEQGRQQGVLEGSRGFLLKLLTTRFGALPQAAITRVSTAGPAELTRWGERILTAPTLADVLDAP